MNESFWFFAATSVAAAAASVSTTPSGPPSAAIDVPFRSLISASDLTIERLSAEVVGKEVRFALQYASGRDRFLSVFEPPGGGAIKYFAESALKAPGGVARFTFPLVHVRSVSAITMRFSTKDGGERDRNLIHLNIAAPAVRPIFGDLRQEDASGRSRNQPSPRQVTEVREVAPYADIRFKDASGGGSRTRRASSRSAGRESESLRGPDGRVAARDRAREGRRAHHQSGGVRRGGEAAVSHGIAATRSAVWPGSPARGR